ncbi:hypothetical protein BUALT_Bualt15G0069600 [Buddleja alternifolia]|uniref:Uncharacterized protein n=1 Tax=Buddleja alternifolia TaxID=168488 RepID=A0AAV6WJV0_9LAMI|nr:hypothetical protein BUALT_Bualt15G0069600 [Buddleja alternifolia]
MSSGYYTPDRRPGVNGNVNLMPRPGSNRPYRPSPVNGGAYQVQPQPYPPPAYGHKRAVLCGITYKGSPQSLNGSINDVVIMRALLVERSAMASELVCKLALQSIVCTFIKTAPELVCKLALQSIVCTFIKETYTTKLKDNQLQSDGTTVLPSIRGSCVVYPEVWAEASGGKKNGRCYGLGNSYNDDFTSSGPSSSTVAAQVEIQHKEMLQEMQQKQEEMMNNFEQRVKEGVIATLTSLGIYPGQYSSPSHSSAPDPGYFPSSTLGHFQTPAPAPAPSYQARVQHPPLHYRTLGRHASPGQHNSSGQHHSQN